MRSAILLMLLAAVAAPRTLLGQRSVPRARLLEELRIAHDSALARLAWYDDSVRRANAKLDSLAVGPIRMNVEPSLRALATRAAQIALDSLRPRMGSVVERARRYSHVLRVERFTQWRTDRPDSNIILELYDRSGPPLANIRQRYDTTLIAAGIRMYVPFLVFRDAAPSFVRWMGGFVSLDSLSAEDWRSLRLGLVSSPAAVARRCYAGDLHSCRMSLQLTPTPDPVREWYDADDRHRIVKQSETVALRIDGVATKRCLGGMDASCAALLRRYPPGSLPEPLTIQTRTMLLRLALQLGGDGAVERVVHGDQEPLARLSAAAQMPVDSLLSRWQMSARTARSSSRDLSAEIVFGALFWSLAFGALSLRSSRWR